MVEDVPMLVRANVTVQQPEFPVFDKPIRIFQIGATRTHGLDLSSGQSDPGLEFFQQEVVVPSDPVYRGIALSRRGGIPAWRFFGVRSRLVCGLAGHRCQ
jgi:hypothetical protein